MEYDMEYGEGFDVDDVVTMKIDIGKKQIIFILNDKDQGIAFENIDFKSIKYKMAVYNSDANVKVQLLDFSTQLSQ